MTSAGDSSSCGGTCLRFAPLPQSASNNLASELLRASTVIVVRRFMMVVGKPNICVNNRAVRSTSGCS